MSNKLKETLNNVKDGVTAAASYTATGLGKITATAQEMMAKAKVAIDQKINQSNEKSAALKNPHVNRATSEPVNTTEKTNKPRGPM